MKLIDMLNKDTNKVYNSFTAGTILNDTINVKKK